MRFSASSIREVAGRVDGPVEVEASVGVDVNVVDLVVSWRVDEADVAGLQEVAERDEVLAVGGDLDGVRA